MLSGGPPAPSRHATLQRALATAAQGAAGLTFSDARGNEHVLPFAELYARGLRTAGALRERGIRRGDSAPTALIELVDYELPTVA